MRKLMVFNSTSLDGYSTGANGDMSFAHNANPDAEWDAFVESNASGGGLLLLSAEAGRCLKASAKRCPFGS
jgi:hypothetical protein